MSDMKIRAEHVGNEVTLYGEGFVIARWVPNKGWVLKVGGEEVPLEEIIRKLNAVQSTLSQVAFGGTE